MKQFKRLLLIAVVTLGMTSFANAQSKVGHISTAELLSVMPEAKALDAKLTKLKNTYDNDLKALDKKLKDKFAKYQAEAEGVTPEENQKRGKELQADEKTLMELAQEAEKKMSEQRNSGIRPIIEKMNKAINDVAKAQGYDYVLDSSTLIVANGTDLMSAVKAKLGIN